MTAERDSMTLNEVSVPALGVEERSDEAPTLSANITETPATFGISVGRWR